MGQDWDETCLVGTKSVLWDGIPAHLEADAPPTELRSWEAKARHKLHQTNDPI